MLQQKKYDVKLINGLLGAVTLVKSSDINKFGYGIFGYGILVMELDLI